MNVWILQTGEPLHCDVGTPRPMRAMNLANALVDKGHKVVLWSSVFYHQEKRQRVNSTDCIKVSESLEIRLIASPGYQRNIGLARLWDHIILGRNLARQLDAVGSVPDVAFVGYPPIETAAVMTKWLAKRSIPFMLDVKDQWPAIFINALPNSLRPFGRIALAPYFYYGHRALRDATALSAMSNGFLEWAAEFAGRSITEVDLVVPLTTATEKITEVELQEACCWWDLQGIKDDGTQRICFIGSHSTAFDIDYVIQTAKLMAAAGNSCQFVLCGSGENTSVWREKVAGLPNVYFPGWIDRAKIEVLARRSSAGLAPYKNTDDFMLSVPNKVIDYLSLGLPVLSPLYGEVRGLILDFEVGLSYGHVVEKTLESCIQDLAVTPDLRKKISDNAINLFKSRFSFELIYGGLVKHLEMLARSR
jgi:glycosyltransferase involved in cell wall biosynthesis